ncbi:MAG: hypothetical protein COV45_07320 [Deltaproteobacteria bacterium CG11_big_fil_rev_8_21_14_0_20_47_16]|nr:MAG: hypothetical protein COV45_07320 [Deltaproteobacteria bacterium CG11_big_fil_rev_8_21_14_0_20_47_16]
MTDFKPQNLRLTTGYTMGPWINVAPIPAATTTQAGTPFAQDIQKSLDKAGPSTTSLSQFNVGLDWVPLTGSASGVPIQSGLAVQFGFSPSMLGVAEENVRHDYSGAIASRTVLMLPSVYPLDLGFNAGATVYVMADKGTPRGAESKQDTSGVVVAAHVSSDISGPIGLGLFWSAGLGISHVTGTTVGQSAIPVSSENAFTATLSLGWKLD